MAEPMAVDSNPESGLDFEFPFAWGKKRGMGGKKKDVQFYDSFSFDGAKYAINDTVCLQSGIGGGEPHIGRLIKIWETRDKSRKVKVQWFFRPAEICKYLIGIEVKPNELFLACGGDGAKGFANVNPLEAIVGKCNVVCISKDVGYLQPSDEAKADYVYYRFFDVVQLKVVD